MCAGSAVSGVDGHLNGAGTHAEPRNHLSPPSLSLTAWMASVYRSPRAIRSTCTPYGGMMERRPVRGAGGGDSVVSSGREVSAVRVGYGARTLRTEMCCGVKPTWDRATQR